MDGKSAHISVWALILGPFWFIGNGMWTRGSTLLMILGVAIYFASHLNISPWLPIAAVNIFSALTGEGFRRSYLERKNFK